MHLLLSVSMLPSLQEITPLPLSRALIVPPLSLTVYSGSQLGRGRTRIRSSPAPPSRGFYPPMCPIIAERLQLSDRRFLLWLDFVSLDVQSLLACDDLAKFSPM